MRPFVIALALACVGVFAAFAFAEYPVAGLVAVGPASEPARPADGSYCSAVNAVAVPAWQLQPRDRFGRWVKQSDVSTSPLLRVRPVFGVARAPVAAPVRLLQAAPVRKAVVGIFGHQRRQQRHEARMTAIQ